MKTTDQEGREAGSSEGLAGAAWNRKERKRLARMLRDVVDEAAVRSGNAGFDLWDLAYRVSYWAERFGLSPYEFTHDIARTLVSTPIPPSELSQTLSTQYPNVPVGDESQEGDPLSFPSGWRLLARVRYAKQPTIPAPFPGRRGPLQQARTGWSKKNLRMYAQGLIQRDVQ
jgi:hypothetical protein